MVYMSGAVSIEHRQRSPVFYSKQKPRVCTINHNRQTSVFGHVALSTNQIRASLEGAYPVLYAIDQG